MSSRTPFEIEEELAVDSVGDLALERAERFLLGLSLGNLALEVDASISPGITDLGDGGHVERMVELSVPAPRQPVRDAAARGPFDRGRAVVRGKGIAVGEASDVAGVADELCGDDRAHPIDVGQ